MRVRANFPRGGHGYARSRGRVYHGDEFEVPDGSSDSWYVPVDEAEVVEESNAEEPAAEDPPADDEHEEDEPPPTPKPKRKPATRRKAPG